MNEQRMYILMNASINMSKGKAVAQAGHGISHVTELMVLNHSSDWKEYSKSSYPKISLKCPIHLLEQIYTKYQDRSQPIWCVQVVDEGRTQLEPGTMTAVVFRPLRKVDVPEEIDQLKLY